MLTIVGGMARQGYFPAPADQLKDLFMDLPRLLEHVQSVEEVRSFDDDIQRILMRRIGALNYYVWLAFDVRMDVAGSVIRAASLPFDPADPWIGENVLLSEYTSETHLVPDGEGTRVDHRVDIKVHVPLPGFLQLMPLGIVKGAADALMRAELVRILEETEGSALKQLALRLQS